MELAASVALGATNTPNSRNGSQVAAFLQRASTSTNPARLVLISTSGRSRGPGRSQNDRVDEYTYALIVARPSKVQPNGFGSCGWANAVIVVIVNPALVMSAGMSRVRWQPPNRGLVNGSIRFC